MAGKGVVRSIKNIAKGFSDVQIKVREATSNDPWGPSGTLMNEIAQLTFNESDFIEIMDMIDKRLNDKGKNWRHVFKALLLLDYCLHVGSENVVLYAKENIYVVKTLKEFQHIDESGKDVGANVRQKAKDITNLLTDDNRLKEERRQRQGMRDRMANVSDYMNESVRNSNPTNENGRYNEESDLKKALAESKRLADEEAKNRNQSDQDLQKALELSQQEALEKERKAKEKLEKENFDNLFAPPQQPLNPYQQPQLQLEWTQPSSTFNFNNNDSFNNPYQQQQQQANPYLQQQQQPLQTQMTGFQQPLYYQQQQQQQQQPLQAQMTGFPPQQPSFQTSMVTGTNPFSQLNNNNTPQQKFDYTELVFGQPKSQAQPQQQQSSQSLFPSNAPNFSNSPSFAHASTAPNFTSSPSFASNAPNFTSSPSFASNAPNFSNSPSFAPSFATTNTIPSPSLNYAAPNAFMSSPQIQRASPKPQSESDLKYAKLNALLANKDDGLDTFGNQGNLRIPYGSGFANSLPISPKQDNAFTNKNPFGQIQQNSPKPQKSLLDLMQEQKQQQQQLNNAFF